jgi:hypothetical protein
MFAALLFLGLAAADGPPLPATDVELKAIRKGLDDHLNDAESARLKDFQVIHTDGASGTACGLINAKNSFGAYVGYEKAQLYLAKNQRDGTLWALPITLDDEIARQVCGKLGM